PAPPETASQETSRTVTEPTGAYSAQQIMEGLETQRGREFELIVTETLFNLGLRSKHIETTQGESDVLAEAWYSQKPYALVVECYAGDADVEVPQDKIGQVRTAFSRYWFEYRKADSVYRVVV